MWWYYRMSQTNTFVLIISGIIILILIVLSIISSEFLFWIKNNWIDLILALILAIVAAIVVEYLYKTSSGKSNFSKTTMALKPRRLLAKLVLSGDKEFIINEYQRIFGREDFIGLLVVDDLLYIGKQHFKLTRLDDGFYIEDMDTINGTVVNGEDISSTGKIKLSNSDEILVAKVLNIRYFELEEL
jgi:hypothetical protein